MTPKCKYCGQYLWYTEEEDCCPLCVPQEYQLIRTQFDIDACD